VSFSIRAIIRAFVAPEHRIRCSRKLWATVAAELYRRSEGRHESGCFLLGTKEGERRHAVEAVFYDELDPQAYSTGVCVLRGKSFARLWNICREKDLDVVADIHTHLRSAFQSEADRTNPMIAERGYVAMIAPNLGSGVSPADLCVYEYLGGHRWTDHSARARRYFYVGSWS